MTEYVELHCHSYFSLLDGASSPEALVERAVALGYPAL
ncbi:MAG: PHP domain-containing protein, partial [Anaerolineae bacterium]|nr:PHP domain-containing protein [Anaerolineae bacterium]